MTDHQSRRLCGALLLIGLFALAGGAQARPWWLRGSAAKDVDFLPPDVAFRVAAHVEGNRLRIHWLIADGYYLYRDKISIQAESPDLAVDPPVLPPGRTLSDPYFGVQAVYFQEAQAMVTYRRSDFGAHPLQIKVTYQGCAEAGLCYPPISKVIFPDDRGAQAEQTPAFTAPYRWEWLAIVGGFLAFLVAGLTLRRGRRLEMPAQ